MKSKIFISYSHQDIEFTTWLVNSLRHNGVDVWWDSQEIAIGDYIKIKIRDGIQASSSFIIILSENSKMSRWVKYELNSALMFNATKNNIKIIPVKIDESAVPNDLNSYLYIDASKDRNHALESILKAVELSDQPTYQFNDWNSFSPKLFEKFVFDLLIQESHNVRRLPQVRHSGFDLEIEEKNSLGQTETILVEIKHFKTNINIGILREIYGALILSNANKALLITSSELTSNAKKYVDQLSHKIVVWEGHTLISKLSESTNLIHKYFPKLTPQDEPVKLIDEELQVTQDLIRELDNCPEGMLGWQKYEDICVKILNRVFVPPLQMPRIQSRRESGIDIRDAIYPNRSTNENWKFIREDYDAKYIVVEFKNYSFDGAEIDKHVVLQIDDYLKKTIGRFGIICSKKHPNMSGLQKRKDVFIEHNKLILFINNDHLKDLLLRKYKNIDPADVIIDLIDDFNMEF